MRLFRQFILRPLIGEKIRTITTVLGVALGIAVVIAIQLTNASSVRGFETALETVAGKTAVEIIGTGTGVDETLLPELGWLRELRHHQPGDRRQRGARRRRREAAVAAADGSGEGARHRHPARSAVPGLPAAGDTAGQRAKPTAKPGQRQSRDFNTQQFLEILTSEQIGRDHREAGDAAQLHARRRAAADDRRSRAAVRRARHPEERRAGARARRQLHPDGHCRGAAGVRSPRPRRSPRRAAAGRRRPGSRSSRRSRRGCRPGSRRSGRRGAASRSRPCWRRFTPTSPRCRGSR